jgi:hypothetical protein
MKTTTQNTKQAINWLNAARLFWAERRGRKPKLQPQSDRYISLNFGLNRSERRRAAQIIGRLEHKLARVAKGSPIAKRIEAALTKAKASYVGSMSNEPYTVPGPNGLTRRQYKRKAWAAKKARNAELRRDKKIASVMRFNSWLTSQI